jgi:GT2 family glycosyltransferase
VSIGAGITVWNRPTYIEQAVVRLAAAHPQEILICDNGSEDEDTLRVLEKLRCEGRRVIHQDKNRGITAAVNALAEDLFERHEFVSFCEDGCLVSPSSLQEMARVLEAESQLGIVCCCLTRGPEPQLPDWHLEWDEAAGSLDNPAEPDLEQGESVIPESDWGRWQSVKEFDPFFFMARREAWQAVGGYDEGFFMGWAAGNDLCYRLRQKDWRVAICWSALGHTWDRYFPPERWQQEEVKYQRDIRSTWMGRGMRYLGAKYAGLASPDGYNIARLKCKEGYVEMSGRVER